MTVKDKTMLEDVLDNVTPEQPQNESEKTEEETVVVESMMEKDFKIKFNQAEFRKRLPLAIEYSGLTRNELHKNAGVTSSMLSNYLYNHEIKPTARTVSKLALHLGVDFKWLAGYEGADIEGYKRVGYYKVSSGVNTRSKALARMMSVHMHQDSTVIPMLTNIIKGMVYMNKQQLNMLSVFVDGMNSSVRYNSGADSSKTLYNDFLDGSESEPISNYNSLIQLNQTILPYRKASLLNNESDFKFSEKIMKIIQDNYNKIYENHELLNEYVLFADYLNNLALESEYLETKSHVDA